MNAFAPSRKAFLKLLKKISMLLRGSRLSRLRVNKTEFLYHPAHDEVIQEYYIYVLHLLGRMAKGSMLNADILLGDYEAQPKGKRQLFRVDFQVEHTLVKPGGRGAEDAPVGVVPIPGNAGICYRVRVQGMARLDRADMVIEYSRPNLVNMQSCGLYPGLAAKLHYVAPLIYPLDESVPEKAERDLEIITLFGNPEEPRRKALLDRLRLWNPLCQNIQGRFDDIRSVYRRTRILINIRQTDHHDTLEELRVLPALLSGVVVISEDVPLRDAVPYHEFILWSSLADLPALVEKVHENYAEYHAQIFSGDRLRHCLAEMDAVNQDTARLLLTQLEARAT